MARGGARPGAGRPKGAKTAKAEPIAKDIRKAARQSGLTPLDYMLTVMNDDQADDARRDRMAIAAAPFCHPRKEPVGAGRKEAAEEAAKEAAAEGSKYAPAPAPRLVIDNA